MNLAIHILGGMVISIGLIIGGVQLTSCAYWIVWIGVLIIYFNA